MAKERAKWDKMDVILNDPGLFKRYQDAVERGMHLRAAVMLGDDFISLCILENDHHEKQPKEDSYYGVKNVQRFGDYNEENLARINELLDTLAKPMKQDWEPEYKRLAEANAVDFEIDTTGLDYAVLKVFRKGITMSTYHCDWSYKDLQETAFFMAKFLNPVLDT